MEKLQIATTTESARAEYIKVEPNVRLHITDAGEGRPIVLLPGWPLSDEMYEYQYNVKDNEHRLFLEETHKYNMELIKFAQT